MAAGRAANGRSSIYKGADGVWYGYVTMGTRPDGTPDRRKRRGKTRAEVTRKIAELEKARAEHNAPAVGESQKLATWLTEP